MSGESPHGRAPRREAAPRLRVGWSRPPASLPNRGVVDGPDLEAPPVDAPRSPPVGSQGRAARGLPLPRRLYVGPQGPIFGWCVLGVLGAFECALWWSALIGPERDGGGRLLAAWERIGSAAAFTAFLVHAAWTVFTNRLASCTVETSPECLRSELRVGWLSLYRALPLSSVSSFELFELGYRGRSAFPGKEYRLVAHLGGYGDVILLYNFDAYARRELVPAVEGLNHFVRHLARPRE